MTLGRIVLVVGALAYGAIGIYALLFPDQVAAVVYIAPDPAVDPTGLPSTGATELRATYGGLGLTVGLFLLYCAWVAHLVRPGLILLFLALLTAVIGRMIGIASDGAQEAYTWIMLFFDVAGAIVVAYTLLRKSNLNAYEPAMAAPPIATAAPAPQPAPYSPTGTPVAATSPTASSAPPTFSPAPPPSSMPGDHGQPGPR